MKKTLLKFSSAIYLIAFRKYSKAKHWEINLNELTVLCDCTDKEAIVACTDFRAMILKPEEQNVNLAKVSEFTVPPVLQRLTS